MPAEPMQRSCDAPIELRELMLVGKTTAAACEDFIHRSRHYLAVIDGASSTAPPVNGRKPGRLIAELVDAALHTMPPRLPARKFFLALSEKVGAALAPHWPAGRIEKPTASVLVYSVSEREVWALGDGWIRIGETCHALKIPYGEAYTLLRCAYLQLRLAEGSSTEELLADPSAFELIRPFIDIQWRIQNRLPPPFGYGVLNGAPSCVDYIRRFKVAPGEEVTLASDGYPQLGSNLAASEAILREALVRDPLMISLYPQVKGLLPGQRSYDDRAWLRFRVRG